MGIGGSALSGVAIMAKREGFSVSGCDLEKDTAYLEKVKKEGIKIFTDHDEEHLKNVDILAVSPAIVYLNKKHPEFVKAKKRGILQIWDEFVGKYLLKNKEVICVTGTHGKSTTTSLAAVLFEDAGIDISSIVGAKVKKWGSNYRSGKSKLFIIEADDFYEKFLNYNPSTIILNNIEFDHPDFFKSEGDMITSYEKFVKLLKKNNNLIVNQDSLGNKKLFDKLPLKLLNEINIYGYTLSDNPKIKLKNSVKGSILKASAEGTLFKAVSSTLDIEGEYKLGIPGEHNVSNALGVIILGKIYGIRSGFVKKTLKNFNGTVRRLEFIGEKRGVSVYDDYAHHPTAIKATIAAIKQKYPNKRIWAIVEPHSYSRTKALLKNYKGVFEGAFKVLVGPIYKARDTETFGVDGNSIVKASEHKNAVYQKDLEGVLNSVKKEVEAGDVILVMGAGYSYKWAREILNRLK
jgi:UDP-N-acetylmuramate--alanine ligase